MNKFITRLFVLFLLNIIYTDVKAENFGIENKLGAYITNNIEVVKSTGDTIGLNKIINKPTIISMVKYNCGQYCPRLLDGLAELIIALDPAPGIDYQVITLVYDTNMVLEKTLSIKQKFTTMLDPLGIDINKVWSFVSVDMKNLHKLTTNLGYHFYEHEDEYIHFSALCIVNQQGKIINYMYGYRFLPVDFKITYKMALKGETRETVPRNLKYCNNYIAPANARLRKIATTTGIIIIFTALSLFLALILKKKRTV